MLVAALNPCPCGYRNDPRRNCQCSVPQIERYMSKISGPLLDRIDLHVEVAAVPYQELAAKATGTSSAQMGEQVLQAHEVQEARFGGGRGRRNSQTTSRELRKSCPLDAAGQAHLKTSVQELGLSARAHDKVLGQDYVFAIEIGSLHWLSNTSTRSSASGRLSVPDGTVTRAREHIQLRRRTCRSEGIRSSRRRGVSSPSNSVVRRC